MVAILPFAIGTGVAIYEGARKIQAQTPISDPAINFVVFALAIGFDGCRLVGGFQGIPKDPTAKLS